MVLVIRKVGRFFRYALFPIVTVLIVSMTAGTMAGRVADGQLGTRWSE